MFLRGRGGGLIKVKYRWFGDVTEIDERPIWGVQLVWGWARRPSSSRTSIPQAWVVLVPPTQKEMT
jgi:hypothetical protein